MEIKYRKNFWERLIDLPGLLVGYFRAVRSEKEKRIGAFMHANRHLLVIVLDPQTDKMVMSYKDKIVVNQIKNVSGKKSKVVKAVLKHSQFKRQIDIFISAMAESLQLKVKEGNLFFQWLDGALFAISKSLMKKK